MTDKQTAIVWFRQDLRLHDNPALIHAAESGYSILPLFILDDENAGEWKRGAASKWWLYKSLQSVNVSLNGNMVFRRGKAGDELDALIEKSDAKAVFWNRCYEPWRIARDKDIKGALKDKGLEVQTFNASLLWEPWEITKDDGTPYKVFTPYYRKGCLKAKEPDAPKPAPANISYADFSPRYSESDLGLLPDIQWYRSIEQVWAPGEQGAQERLDAFLDDGMKGYKQNRNRPDMEKVSRLSPHLHFGEISPRKVWHDAQGRGMQAHWESDMDTFCSELGWREFSYSLLYQHKNLMRAPLQEKFKNFPWDKNDKALLAWQKGQTGIPIIDAGMRQLWQTGWMHNRVRMVVASFLIKNLRIHWHEGEEWFWDTLVDADLANNAASWQWVAGCGADAAPYFRIFNPVTQGQKFDPDGKYVRQYVPELKNMPDKFLHNPWEAGEEVLRQAGVTLGTTYPEPIADLKESRKAALECFETIKKSA